MDYLEEKGQSLCDTKITTKNPNTYLLKDVQLRPISKSQDIKESIWALQITSAAYNLLVTLVVG